MAQLKLTPTNNTPRIDFDTETNEYWISGLSKPEEPLDFYGPIIDFVRNMEVPTQKAHFNFKLDYFNSASNKLILEMLKELETKGENVAINWHYDKIDEAMIDAAEDYMDNVKIPINMCPYEDN